MYISNGIKFQRRLDLENELIEYIWVEILLNASKNFLICCLYRPLSGSCYLKNFNKHFQNMLSLATAYDKEVILLGDVNANYLVKDDCKDFKHILTLLGLKQLVKEPTRTCVTTKMLIDIIASTKPKLIWSTQVFPSGFSDHNLVGCICKHNHQKFSPKEIECRDYSQYNFSEINYELSTADWSDIYKTKDINKVWKVFHQIMLNIFDKHAPIIVKRVKSKPDPWLIPEIKAAMNDQDRQLRKCCRTNLDQDKIK